ncbi:MAG: NEW3 domain-containing protein [Ignavibacteriales bacterium]|nr:NEW3 domain-containing protein [Ignavibacteriales bacterium]
MKKLILLLFILIVGDLCAQSSGSYYNPKDDKYRLLGLKRAKEQYDVAKSDYDRQQAMFGKQLISQQELQRSKSVYSDAEVNYYQALLAVLFEEQYVTVAEAVKYQSKDGKKHVRLKLANASSGGEEFKKLINIEDALFKSLQPEVVNNIYVSILNGSNSIISQPYEAKIDELHYGKPQTIDFTLLQDLDEVTVNIIYGNGTQRAPKIFLQKDQSVNKVVLQSDQFSQEVDLGGSASFSMSLELFSGTTNTYKLEAVNLPKQINKFFVDPATQARLSQFKFGESTQTRKTNLQVFLPDRSTGEVQIDKPISFFVLAIPYDKVNSIDLNEDRIWKKEELDKLDIGYLKLEIIPRGTGELKVNSGQLYFSILPGNKIEVPIDIKNEGTRRLDNVEFELDLPLNWTQSINPKIVESIDIREEKRIVFTLTPPDNVTVGKYDIRLRTTCLADDKLVKAEDKTITIEVKQSDNVIGTILIVLLIIGLVAGIVIFGIKLTRK